MKICECCNCEFEESTIRNQKYCSDKCGSKVRNARYQKTDKRKAALHKYNTSEKRKATSQRYLDTENGYNTTKRGRYDYNRSHEGRARRRERDARRYIQEKQGSLNNRDRESIVEFYKNCPEGYHVDHIVPIAGKNVCGLHVINNLQYLPARDNIIKGNKFKED